jgi:hypothetical protein
MQLFDEADADDDPSASSTAAREGERPWRYDSPRVLLNRLLELTELLGQIRDRGGIVSVVEAVGVPRGIFRKLDAALDCWKLLRQFVGQLGDARRVRGESVPLCWLPSPDSEAMVTTVAKCDGPRVDAE